MWAKKFRNDTVIGCTSNIEKLLIKLLCYRYTKAIYCTFACEAVAGIAVLADAVVATVSVHTCGVLVA